MTESDSNFRSIVGERLYDQRLFPSKQFEKVLTIGWPVLRTLGKLKTAHFWLTTVFLLSVMQLNMACLEASNPVVQSLDI